MLTAFKKNLSNNPDRLGRLYKSDPHEEISILRKRFSQNGYLYLKGLLTINNKILKSRLTEINIILTL